MDEAKQAREKVLAVLPGQNVEAKEIADYWCIFRRIGDSGTGHLLGSGSTEDNAWIDASSRLAPQAGKEAKLLDDGSGDYANGVCESILHGKKNAKVHGCIKPAGHTGLHVNGRNVSWMQWDTAPQAGTVEKPQPLPDSGCNYVANQEQRPTEVRFSNGRRVWIVTDETGPYLEVSQMIPGEVWLRDAADAEAEAGFIGAGDTPYNRAVLEVVKGAGTVEHCTGCEDARRDPGGCHTHQGDTVEHPGTVEQGDGFEAWLRPQRMELLRFATDKQFSLLYLEGLLEAAWLAASAEYKGRVERAEQRIVELAALFGVCDGGRYLNDWKAKHEQLTKAREQALREAAARAEIHANMARNTDHDKGWVRSAQLIQESILSLLTPQKQAEAKEGK